MIDVKPEHWRMVSAILKTYLPPHTKVWVFGSRAKHTARPFSDLASDFEDSDLPYKVDLLDWVTASSSFKQAIISHRIAVDLHVS